MRSGKMEKKFSKEQVLIAAIAGILIGMFAGSIIVFAYHPSALLPEGSSLTSNSQIMNAQIFKYVNVSDLRVNSAYYYPDNCTNLKTDYAQNNITTPAYMSAVILSNATASEGFISVPYIINGSMYEYHYVISCS